MSAEFTSGGLLRAVSGSYITGIIKCECFGGLHVFGQHSIGSVGNGVLCVSSPTEIHLQRQTRKDYISTESIGVKAAQAKVNNLLGSTVQWQADHAAQEPVARGYEWREAGPGSVPVREFSGKSI